MQGDIVDALAAHQALEYRKLALGQLGVGWPRIGQTHLEDHAVGQLRVDIAPTASHLANRRDQQGRVAVLGGVAGGADLEGAGGHLRLVVHGQHQNRRRPGQGANPRDGLQAVDPGHGDIQQYHVALDLAQGLQQLLAIARLAGHLKIAGHADQLLDAFTHDGVIFGYHHSNHATSSVSRVTRAVRVVPSPG